MFLTFDNGDQVSGTSADGEVLYAGGASGSVAGLLQLNVRVPPDALAGNAVDFLLIIGRDRVPGSLTMALR
jgi:uncharacterized protein (TIGR03437 family)